MYTAQNKVIFLLAVLLKLSSQWLPNAYFHNFKIILNLLYFIFVKPNLRIFFHCFFRWWKEGEGS